MRPELMTGMFWAGMLLSSIPVAFGIWFAVFVVRQMKAERSLTNYPAGPVSGPDSTPEQERG